MNSSLEWICQLAKKAAKRIMRTQTVRAADSKGKETLKDALKATKATNVHPPWQIGQKKNRPSKSKSPPEKPSTGSPPCE